MCQHVTRFLSRGIILYIQISSTKQKVWEATQIIPSRPSLRQRFCLFLLTLRLAEALRFYAN